MSMKNSNETIGNRSRALSVYSAVHIKCEDRGKKIKVVLKTPMIIYLREILKETINLFLFMRNNSVLIIFIL
jgi:hypothetical protein